MAPEPSDLRTFFKTKRGREFLERLDLTRLPDHVAVIMDGNGRWASRRGLPRIAGHTAGAKAVRELIASALTLGVPYLTIYSFSTENWSRPADEVRGLMSLFVEVLQRELVNLESRGVRLRVIGDTSELPVETREAFRASEERTRGLDTLTLVVALNYSGRADIVQSVRSIAADAAAGSIDPADVDAELLAARLWTSGIPDPDLLIRTSGEMRISNFLLWEVAYTEFWITRTLWPDFDRTDLLHAIVDFQQRTRRFGGSE